MYTCPFIICYFQGLWYPLVYLGSIIPLPFDVLIDSSNFPLPILPLSLPCNVPNYQLGSLNLKVLCSSNTHIPYYYTHAHPRIWIFTIHKLQILPELLGFQILSIVRYSKKPCFCNWISLYLHMSLSLRLRVETDAVFKMLCSLKYRVMGNTQLHRRAAHLTLTWLYRSILVYMIELCS